MVGVFGLSPHTGELVELLGLHLQHCDHWTYEIHQFLNKSLVGKLFGLIRKVEEEQGKYDRRSLNSDYWLREIPQQPLSAFCDEDCRITPVIPVGDFRKAGCVVADAKMP